MLFLSAISRRSLFGIALAAVTGAGAWLRLRQLSTPSLWLDEILSYGMTDQALALPWYRWLTGLDNENGPLYLLTQAAGRIAVSPELSTRIVASLIGVITVPLLALSGAKLTGRLGTGLVAASLLAVSPLHVYYSREGRHYALLLFWTTLFLATLGSRWKGSRAIFAVACIGAVYTAATSLPVLLSLVVVCAVLWLVAGEKKDADVSLSFEGWFALGSLIGGFLLYFHLERAAAVLDFPTISVGLLNEIAQGMTVAVMDRRFFSPFAYAVLLTAVVGARALCKRSRRAGLIAVLMTLLPISVSLAGLIAFDHWFAIRYLAAGLPALLTLVAEGIFSLGELVSRRGPFWFRRGMAVAAVAISVIFFSVIAIPAATTEPYQKANWRLLASTLWHHAEPGDRVISSNSWTHTSLSFYLGRLPPRVTSWNAAESPEGAYHIAKQSKAAWLVSAGFHNKDRVVGWMCRSYPVVASRGEDLQLFFYPDFARWMDLRATKAERDSYASAFWSDRLGRLDMSEGDAIFLRGEWGGAEHNESGGAFRWIEGDMAQLVVPASSGNRLLRFRALPAELPGQTQTLTVLLNDRPFATIPLRTGWSDYQLALPNWEGSRALIGFVLSGTVSPAETSGSSDHRRLSAAFDFIEIIVPGSSERAEVASPGKFTTLRPQLLDERGRAVLLLDPPLRSPDFPRIAPANWREEPTRMLVRRFGYDGELAFQALHGGTATMEDLLDGVVERSDCVGNDEYIRELFRILLYREPDTEGLRVYGSRLHRGISRRKIAMSMLRSEEFASKHLREPMKGD